MTVTLAVITAHWLPFIAILWCFDLVDALSSQLFLTALVSIPPVVTFFAKPQPGLRRRAWTGEFTWMAAFLWLAAPLAASEKLGLDRLGTQLSLIIVNLPLCGFIWLSVRRNWWLLPGLLLALILFTVYWIAALVRLGESWELILLPLLLTSFGGAAWAPVAALVLNVARRRKHHRISGPAWQVTVMVILFLPVTIVAVIVPGMLQLNPIWSAVSLTMLGVLLSSVVSEPLRRVLIEWGDLRSLRES